MRVGIGGISSVSMQICLRCIQNPSSIINIIIDFFFPASFQMLSLFYLLPLVFPTLHILRMVLKSIFLEMLPIFFHQQLSLNYFSKLELMSEVSDITHFPLYHCHTLYPKVIQSWDLFFVAFLLITWWCISCCNFLPLRIRKYCLFSGSNF